MFTPPNARKDMIEAAVRRGVMTAMRDHGIQHAAATEFTVDRPLEKGDLVLLDGQPHRVVGAKPGSVPGSISYDALPGFNRHERRAKAAGR